jgi:hypothetical protein
MPYIDDKSFQRSDGGAESIFSTLKQRKTPAELNWGLSIIMLPILRSG